MACCYLPTFSYGSNVWFADTTAAAVGKRTQLELRSSLRIPKLLVRNGQGVWRRGDWRESTDVLESGPPPWQIPIAFGASTYILGDDLSAVNLTWAARPYQHHSSRSKMLPIGSGTVWCGWYPNPFSFWNTFTLCLVLIVTILISNRFFLFLLFFLCIHSLCITSLSFSLCITSLCHLSLLNSSVTN